MTDENAGRLLSALDDIVKVVDTWTAEVRDAVNKNLSAARTDGLTAGTVAEWSVKAVEMLLNGSLRVGGAVLDGVTLFDDDTTKDSTTVVKDVLVTSTSALPVALSLELVGNSTHHHVAKNKIVITPPFVSQGARRVRVKVDVVGLPNDLYVGHCVCSGKIDAQPQTVLIAHLTA